MRGFCDLPGGGGRVQESLQREHGPGRASHSAGGQLPRKLGIPLQGGERRHGSRRLPRLGDWESRARRGSCRCSRRQLAVPSRMQVHGRLGSWRRWVSAGEGGPGPTRGDRHSGTRGPEPPGQPRHLSTSPKLPFIPRVTITIPGQSLRKGLTDRTGGALHKRAHACTWSPSSPGGPVPNSPRDKARAQPLLGNQAKKCSKTRCLPSTSALEIIIF